VNKKREGVVGCGDNEAADTERIEKGLANI
jgi:hypothetical protein